MVDRHSSQKPKRVSLWIAFCLLSLLLGSIYSTEVEEQIEKHVKAVKKSTKKVAQRVEEAFTFSVDKTQLFKIDPLATDQSLGQIDFMDFFSHKIEEIPSSSILWKLSADGKYITEFIKIKNCDLDTYDEYRKKQIVLCSIYKEKGKGYIVDCVQSTLHMRSEKDSLKSLQKLLSDIHHIRCSCLVIKCIGGEIPLESILELIRMCVCENLCVNISASKAEELQCAKKPFLGNKLFSLRKSHSKEELLDKKELPPAVIEEFDFPRSFCLNICNQQILFFISQQIRNLPVFSILFKEIEMFELALLQRFRIREDSHILCVDPKEICSIRQEETSPAPSYERNHFRIHLCENAPTNIKLLWGLYRFLLKEKIKLLSLNWPTLEKLSAWAQENLLDKLELEQLQVYSVSYKPQDVFPAEPKKISTFVWLHSKSVKVFFGNSTPCNFLEGLGRYAEKMLKDSGITYESFEGEYLTDKRDHISLVELLYYYSEGTNICSCGYPAWVCNDEKTKKLWKISFFISLNRIFDNGKSFIDIVKEKQKKSDIFCQYLTYNSITIAKKKKTDYFVSPKNIHSSYYALFFIYSFKYLRADNLHLIGLHNDKPTAPFSTGTCLLTKMGVKKFLLEDVSNEIVEFLLRAYEHDEGAVFRLISMYHLNISLLDLLMEERNRGIVCLEIQLADGSLVVVEREKFEEQKERGWIAVKEALYRKELSFKELFVSSNDELSKDLQNLSPAVIIRATAEEIERMMINNLLYKKTPAEDTCMELSAVEVVLSFPEEKYQSIDLLHIKAALNHILRCFKNVKQLYVENAHLTKDACTWCFTEVPEQIKECPSLFEILLRNVSVESPSPDIKLVLERQHGCFQMFSSLIYKNINLYSPSRSPGDYLFSSNILLIKEELLDFLIRQKREHLFPAIEDLEWEERKKHEERKDDTRNALKKFIDLLRGTGRSTYICNLCKCLEKSQPEKADRIWALLPCSHIYHADCLSRRKEASDYNEEAPVCPADCDRYISHTAELFLSPGISLKRKEEEKTWRRKKYLRSSKDDILDISRREPSGERISPYQSYTS